MTNVQTDKYHRKHQKQLNIYFLSLTLFTLIEKNWLVVIKMSLLNHNKATIILLKEKKESS